MTSDMMIVCKEDGSFFRGKNRNMAVFVDECSMGQPSSEFGDWFADRYCGIPTIIEQMYGHCETSFRVFTEEDHVAVELAMKNRRCHQDMDKVKVMKYLKEHIGKEIATENW